MAEGERLTAGCNFGVARVPCRVVKLPSSWSSAQELARVDASDAFDRFALSLALETTAAVAVVPVINFELWGWLGGVREQLGEFVWSPPAAPFGGLLVQVAGRLFTGMELRAYQASGTPVDYDARPMFLCDCRGGAYAFTLGANVVKL